jgi:predicted ArsR family transcriptional regulator
VSELEDAGRHAALASPVRRRVLKVLGEAAAAPTAQQLASLLDLHVSTVRFHLDQLEEARLVVRETRHAARRGRPSVVFHAVGLDAGRALEPMIEALADAAAAPDRAEGPLAAGRRWAGQLPVPTGTALEAIADAFGRLGFDPEPAGDTLRLRACPFRDAARRHPDVVCRVHLGLAQGLAGRAPRRGDVRMELVPFVEQQLCLLTLRAPEPEHAR